ncbi:MAG: ABC transporter ATP-binding protein [Candidatus Paceibacterota bacterium]
MKNSFLYLYENMWKYSKGNHYKVILYSLMSISSNLIYALEPLVVGLFLNMVQTQGVNSASVLNLLLVLSLLLVIEVCVWALHGPSRMIENRNAFGVKRTYKNYLLKGTIGMPMEWHSNHHSGDVIDKVEKGSSALFSFSGRMYEVIEAVILLVTSFCVLFFFDVVAGLILLLITGITFFVLTVFDKKLIPGYDTENRNENKISEKVFDVLSNVATIIILRMAPSAQKSIDDKIKDSFYRFDKNNFINEWKWCFASLAGRIAMMIVISVYLLSNASSGSILVGTIYILYGYTNQVRMVFFRFAYLYNDIVRYGSAVRNSEILAKDFDLIDEGKSQRLNHDWSKLEIEGLSFSYSNDGKNNMHLDDISMTIPKGQKIALIGESGGGKTTFLKVFRGLYNLEKVELSVDGKALKNGFVDISDSIALIPQDPEIFATTIRDNITFGIEHTDMHIKVFTDMACFTQVAERLPNKLESFIFEKGVNLSGGEKQRLALARGLLASSDKEVVLLDEPTSSVDSKNELKIFKNVFSAFPRKTIIVSVHRLHLLSLFDMIYFFDKGKIIAYGTLNELKANSPEFNNLWQKYTKTNK